jgi:hypothetical protein
LWVRGFLICAGAVLATATVLGLRWTILAVGRAAEIRRFVASFTTAG